MTRNNISQLRNRSLFLFTDEEMNPRQDANREEVLSFFTPLANNIVAKILEAGDCYLQYAEGHAIARRENTFCASNMHGLIIEHLSQLEGVRIVQICHPPLLHMEQYLFLLPVLQGSCYLFVLL